MTTRHRLLLGGLFALGFAISLASQPPRGLSGDTMRKLTSLRLRGITSVQVHIAAKPGQVGQAAAEVIRLGGSVRFRADDISYLRVVLPTTDRATLEKLLSFPAVEAVAASLSGAHPNPSFLRPGTEQPDPPMGSEPPLPIWRPYRPIFDLDGEEFLREHPTYDGRGVVIGMFDGLPDVLHPNLSRAKDLAGRTLPKFAEVEYTGSAADDSPNRGWTRTELVTVGPDRRIRWNGREFTAPHAGEFRLGFSPLPRMTTTNVSVVIDGQRDVAVPILWEVRTDFVWVDGDLDGSFANERSLRPFRRSGDIGILGRDDPATPRRESLGFTVGLDPEANSIRLNPCWALHGTAVAGSAAANDYDSGRFDALAGSAQLAAYECSPYYDAYNLVETVYGAVSNPKVDVFFIECDLRQEDGYFLRDGHNAITIALDRIATRFNKLIFLPAGNTAGMGQLMELGCGPNLICVQAYDSAAALRAHSGVDVPHRDNLHSVGAYGPSGAGALKPDLMAPAAHLTAESMFYTDALMRLPGQWQLPYGYAIGGGTSCATPTAAAAAALLISAAKQENIPWDAERLRYALFASARLCDNLPVHQQGRGLIQIGGAWKILQALAQDPSFRLPSIKVEAPVRTALSSSLGQPDKGVGIYERGGWHAGDVGQRSLVLTRSDGPPGLQEFRLRWRGATDAFACARSVKLPLNVPVTISVDIRTAVAGAHSALLDLIPVGSELPVVTILNTIVAGEVLPGGELHRELEVDRQTSLPLYLEVPPGVSMLTVDLAKDTTETTRFMLYPPGYDISLGRRATLREGRIRLAVASPPPGVWELLVENRSLSSDQVMATPPRPAEPRESPLRAAKIALDVSMLRFSAKTEPDSNPESNLRQIKFLNQGMPMQGKLLWSGLGAEQSSQAELLPGRGLTFTISVPSGSRILRAEWKNSEENPTPVTFSAFRVRNGSTINQDRQVQYDGTTAFTIEKPEPGDWKVVVESVVSDGKPIRGAFSSVVVHDQWGALECEDAGFKLRENETWTGSARAKPVAGALARERLVGVMAFGTSGTGVNLTDSSSIMKVIFPLD